MTDLAPYEIVPMVARMAAIITPKAPYLEWAKKIVQEDGGSASPKAEPTAFLLPGDFLNAGDARDWLRENCEPIFAQMLTSWHRDRATWPKSLTNWPLFTAWFDIRVVDSVYDLDSETPWMDSDEQDD